MKALVDFVDNNETRPLAYKVFFNGDGTRMTVLLLGGAALAVHDLHAGFTRFTPG